MPDASVAHARDTGRAGPEVGTDARPIPPDGKPLDGSAGTLRLLAGNPGGPGHVDGTGSAARFHTAHGIAQDGAGNLLLADTYNSTIRRVNIASAEVTTLAGLAEVHGSSDGVGAAARFYYPQSVASDGAGSLFVADTDNHIIRRVDIASGRVTTLAGSAMLFGTADGVGALARFHLPAGIASDGAGRVFVADTHSHTIRQVTIANGDVTTLAGAPGENGSQDGVGAAARFSYPTDLTSDGRLLFISDGHGQVIRRLVLATGEVTTVAGMPEQPGNAEGDRRTARFDGLHGMVSDGAGTLFIADSENRVIKRLALDTGTVTRLAGTLGEARSRDGAGRAASFSYPFGLAHDGKGNLFVSDAETVRRIALATTEVTTLAGAPEHAGDADGIGAAALFHAPLGMASDPGEGARGLIVADSANHCLRRVDTASGLVTTLAGTPGQPGSRDGQGASARFFTPTGVASDGKGHVFIADSENRTIRKLWLASGEVTTLAGAPGEAGQQDGRGAAARFDHPHDLASDHAGHLFVTDSEQHAIRMIELDSGQVTTLAGSARDFGSVDGTGPKARFDLPRAMACDKVGNLYVADFGNYTIRKIVIATGEVTTLAGTPQESGMRDGPGHQALFGFVAGLACDGAKLFVADQGNHVVRILALDTQSVRTVVGAPELAGLRLGPLPAGLDEPSGLALHASGELFISLAKENAIVAARF